MAKIEWQRGQQEFVDNKYSRQHSWEFDGGLVVPASASPDIVPLPYSVEYNLDPEEAFVAAVSSCHMLFFLSMAVKKQCRVNSYLDNAVGIMEKDETGVSSITRIKLQPRITGEAAELPVDTLQQMHEQAHKLCFIANSIKSEITIDIGK